MDKPHKQFYVKRYKCAYCTHQFKKTWYVRRHLIKKHEIPSPRYRRDYKIKIKCNLCHVILGDDAQWLPHLEMHHSTTRRWRYNIVQTDSDEFHISSSGESESE